MLDLITLKLLYLANKSMNSRLVYINRIGIFVPIPWTRHRTVKDIERILIYRIAIIRLWAYRYRLVKTRPHQTNLVIPPRPQTKELNMSSCGVQSRAKFLSP
jgi:hypothetical protein